MKRPLIVAMSYCAARTTFFGSALSHRHLIIILLSLLASVGAWPGAVFAIPPCDHIDFDDQPPGTLFTAANQPYELSKGVTFFDTCPGNPFVQLFPLGVTGNPPSPTNALSSPTGDPLVDCCVTINFADAQRWVSLQIAAELFAANSPQTALQVQACDAMGNILITNNAVLVRSFSAATGSVVSWVKVTFNAGNCIISQVKVCNSFGVQMQQFYIEDVQWGDDTTRPDVIIDLPAEKECICDGNFTVQGSSCDNDGCGFVLFTELRIRPIISGQTATTGFPPWTLLATSFTPCFSGPLFSVVLPVSQFPEGEYLLEMIGTNACLLQNWDNRVIHIDRNPPTVIVNCPINGQIVNGNLGIIGTISDLCPDTWHVRLDPIGPFPGPFSPPSLTASGTGNVGPGLITCLNTTLVADGSYHLTVRAVDQCNRRRRDMRKVIVDNTKPVAIITEPAPCLFTCQDDMAPIMGFVADAHLAFWTLEYKMGNETSWTPIASGTNPVGNLTTGTPGLIALWNQCPQGVPLKNCCYSLRLTVYDKAKGCPGSCGPAGPNTAVDEICANLGLRGDLTGDGVVDGADLSIILGGPSMCPLCP